MLSDKEKALLKKLELPYPCVAVKYRFEKPDAPHYDGGKLAYCQYVKYAQETGNHFYITAEDDACYGKMPLGMIGKPPVTASGQAGYDFGIYKSPVGAQQLYQWNSAPLKDAILTQIFSSLFRISRRRISSCVQPAISPVTCGNPNPRRLSVVRGCTHIPSSPERSIILRLAFTMASNAARPIRLDCG